MNDFITLNLIQKYNKIVEIFQELVKNRFKSVNLILFMLIILLSLLGFILGIIAGLFPGIHINLFIPIALLFFKLNSDAMFFLIPLAISYSFLNTIPSIFLGIPDESTVFSLMPGARMTKKGKGMLAFSYTINGSLIGAIFGTATGYFLCKSKINLTFLNSLTVPLLTFILLFFSRTKNRIIATAIFSGIGFLVFNLKLNQPLFHVFSGSFALFNALNTTKSKLPNQESKIERIRRQDIVVGTFATVIALIALYFPGISPSISIILIIFLFSKSKIDKDKLYLFSTGVLNSAAYAFTPFLVLKGISRNYVAIALKNNISIANLETILALTFTTIIISHIISMLISEQIIKLLPKINYEFVNLIPAIFVLLLSYYFDSLMGLLIVVISYLGLKVAIRLKVPRYYILSTIIFPVLMKKL